MEITQRLARLEDTVRLLHESALYAERTKIGRLNPVLFGFPFELHRHSSRNLHGYLEDAQTGVFKTSRMFFKVSTVQGSITGDIVQPSDIKDSRVLVGFRDNVLYLQHDTQDGLTVDDWVKKALSAYGVTEYAVARVDIYDRPLYFPLEAFVVTGEARGDKLRMWLNGLSPAWKRDICLMLADARLMDELGVARMLRELAAVL